MSQQTATVAAEPSLSDLVDHLTRFDGPPEQFLLHMLAVQCHIGSARGGTVMRTRKEGEPEVLAVYPVPEQEQTAPVWLAHAAEQAAKITRSTETVIRPLQGANELYDQAAREHLVMIPLRSGEGVRGMAAYVIETTNTSVLNQRRERLELTMSLLSLFEMRLTLQRRQADMLRLRQALEVLSTINEQDRFRAAAMSLCNEVASVWNAERVTLGFHKGRYVRAVAMSHTEKLTRKMKLVLDIESGMEECLDQDVEIIYPSSPDATYVDRATGTFARRHGPTTVCSLPLRQGPKTIGVLVVERPPDKPFDIEAVESLRLLCELCTARLADLYEHDKWIGAKAAGAARKVGTTIVGPEYTWVKLAAIGVLAAIVFLTFAKGTDYAEGSFVIEAIEQRIVPAPFDGYLDEVHVERNDAVVAGETLMATLDVTDLGLQKSHAVAELNGHAKERQLAAREGDTVRQQIAEAEMDKFQAQIGLLQHQIDQAEIAAPMTGVVIEGDLKKEQGAPVEKGQVLFVIAPIEALRADVSIPEDRVADLRKHEVASLAGEITAVTRPGLHIPVTVERLSPVAEVVNQTNVYRIRAKLAPGAELDQAMSFLIPGSEGVARIEVGRAHYAWIWTRKLVNWVRMKLWW